MNTRNKRTAIAVMMIALLSAVLVVPALAADEIIWEYTGVSWPQRAERLSNGNTLIADCDLSSVFEVAPDGTIVWEYPDEYLPYDADRLSNGNTLIVDSCYGDGRVIEVTPDGTIVWEYIIDSPADPCSANEADRLSNGNTLISVAFSGVFEVAPDGTIVWEYSGVPGPYDADRLPNGNTLIPDWNADSVYEITSDGTIVWEYPTTGSEPCEVQRLPNGNTLIVDWAEPLVFEVGEPAPPWSLTLKGVHTYVVTQQEFEDAIPLATSLGYFTEYNDGTDVWGGLPLWILVGFVDGDFYDEYPYDVSGSIDAEDIDLGFNDAAAAESAYDAKLIASDESTVTIDPWDLARNDYMFVANTKNGAPLPEEDWPLRLVGSDVDYLSLSISCITEIELVGLYEEEPWNLTLNGEVTAVINRTSFEEGVACHNVSWTDGSARTWTGIPLWRLVGWVDDTDQHDFNDALADAGYEITVIAGDGYNKTFDSSFVKRNDDIILANELDGAPIPEDSSSYPLRLTGSALTSGQNVKNVVEILLTFPVPWEGYLVPQDSAGSYGEDTPVELWVEYNGTGLTYGALAYQIDLHFDPSCVNITAADFSTSPFGSHIFNPLAPGVVRILEDNYLTMVPLSSGTYKLATLTLHGESLAGSTSDLWFDPAWCVVSDTDGNPIENRYTNGTYTCAAPQPDLVITAKSEDWVNFDEKTYNVTYTVKNAGAAEAGASTTSVTIDGAEVATDPVPGLAADASYTSTVGPFTMSGDSDTINVCADRDDAVEEIDETNNCLENEWTALLKVEIGDYLIAPGSTVKAPITIYGIQNYGTGTISVTFDKAVAQVTTVESSSDSTVTSSSIDNPAGIVSISAWNVTGVSGDIVFAYVTFKAVGTLGSSTALDLTVSSLRDISYNNLPAYTDNGSLAITESAPPIVSNPTATPDTILNDNGRARVPGTNVSQLSVHVTDTIGVSSVTVNLTPIRGPGNDAVPLTLIAGDSTSGTWAVDVTATYDAGVDQTHCLAVNATDVFGNSNTAKCIPLTVLRRGDVVRDNVVDMGDALYIARYTVGLELAPDEFVAGVVPASSWDGVDMGDALYIARYTVGTEVAP
jgi:hypothetical protein